MDTKRFSHLAALLSVQPVKHAAEHMLASAGIGAGLGAGLAVVPGMLSGKKRNWKNQLVAAAMGGVAGGATGAGYNFLSGGRGFSDVAHDVVNPKPQESPYVNNLRTNAVSAIPPIATTAGALLSKSRLGRGVFTAANVLQGLNQARYGYKNLTSGPASTGRDAQWLMSRADNPTEIASDWVRGAP